METRDVEVEIGMPGIYGLGEGALRGFSVNCRTRGMILRTLRQPFGSPVSENMWTTTNTEENNDTRYLLMHLGVWT